MFFLPPTPPALIAQAAPVCRQCIVYRQKLPNTRTGCPENVLVYQSDFNGKAWAQAGFGYGPVVQLTVSPKWGGVYTVSAQALN